MEEGLDWSRLEELGQVATFDSTAREEILGRAASSRILLTNKTPLDRATLFALPHLEFISVLATGFNVVDVEAARERGIPVSNIPAYGTETVAQHAWAMILELCNRVGPEARANSEGAWAASRSWTHWRHPMVELAGRRLGLIGRGPIARRMAEIGRAFGMEVAMASISLPEGGDGLAPLDEVRRTADVLSLHCRLTPASDGLVDSEFLRGMKPTAFLINTARGALVVEADLAEALRRGGLAGAALDVLREEPPAFGHPLLGLENCLITGHMAWSGRAARQRLVEKTVENVRAFLEGSPVNVVNG